MAKLATTLIPKRVRNAALAVETTTATANADAVAQQIHQLNSTLGNFVDELHAWVGLSDPDKVSKPDWYWGSYDPRDAPFDTTEVTGSYVNKTEATDILWKRAVCLSRIENAVQRIRMAYLIQSGLKGLHAQSTDSKLNESLDNFRKVMTTKIKKHCVEPSWSKWIRTDVPYKNGAYRDIDFETGELIEVKCYTSLSESTIKAHMLAFADRSSKAQVLSLSDTLRVDINARIPELLSNIEALANVLYGISVLWEVEIEEGVPPEAKEELAREWNKQIAELLEEENVGEQEESFNFIALAVGVICAGGTFWFMKKRDI